MRCLSDLRYGYFLFQQGTPPSQQRLVFKGSKVRDGDRTLSDCGIAAGAMLHLVPPLSGFHVEAPHGGFQQRPGLEGRLREWLAAERPSKAFVLWGLGGSGKSTLARSFAHAASCDECGPAGDPLRLVFMLSAASIEQDYAGLLGESRRATLSGRRRTRVSRACSWSCRPRR